VSLSRSNRHEQCQVRLTYLITDGRLVLTNFQTLQCSRLTPQQLNPQILGILFQFSEAERTGGRQRLLSLKKILFKLKNPRRAQIALTLRVESKEDFAQFRIFRDSEVISVCQSLTSHVIETSSEVRTVQYQFSNYTR
jgi:hypothetical protein